jgi:hypothetical protein
LTNADTPTGAVDRETLAPRVQAATWRAVLGAHAALAAFVSFGNYPITQDGPAHLYAAHILRSLARDPDSPFRPYFKSNLRPAGNSLFFWLFRRISGLKSSEGAARRSSRSLRRGIG